MEPVKIGAFLAQLRRERNLTQQELGAMLGVTNKTISRWETGCYLPNVEMMQLLGRVFGVTVEELLSGERTAALTPPETSDFTPVQPELLFSLRERYRYWKKKWLRDHRLSIALWSLPAIFLLILAWRRSEPLYAGLAPLTALAAYLRLRNDMLAYVENKAYNAPQD